MIVGIDWDGTYAAHRDLFDLFVAAAHERGHTCIIVTSRARSFPVPDPPVPVIYSNGRPKKTAAEEGGYLVDIWIDDNPIMVDLGIPRFVNVT